MPWKHRDEASEESGNGTGQSRYNYAITGLHPKFVRQWNGTITRMAFPPFPSLPPRETEFSLSMRFCWDQSFKIFGGYSFLIHRKDSSSCNWHKPNVLENLNSLPGSKLLPFFVEWLGYEKKALGLRIWTNHLWQKKVCTVCIQEYARGNQSQLPAVVERVLECTYLDDSMNSTVDEKSFNGLYHQLWELLTKASMHARKWHDFNHEDLPLTKTLRAVWVNQTDVFMFGTFTKRNFLKNVATLFDPLGLVTPFTIRATILLQVMWTCGLDWVDEIGKDLAD